MGSKLIIIIGFLSLLVAIKCENETTITQSNDKIPRCNITIDLRNITNFEDHGLKPVITSPSYPFDYPSNIDLCTYLVKFDENYGVKLLFSDFDLQNAECGDELNECCDYLEIGIGLKVGENQVKKLCGNNQHFEPIFINSNEIWLMFHSDKEENYKGFSASVTPFQLTYNELKSKINPPTYDDTIKIYPNDVDIIYKIDLPENFIVVLKFNSINLEFFTETCFDYIEIIDPLSNDTAVPLSDGVEDNYEGKLQSSKVICGYDEPDDYIAKGNKLNLRFHSDRNLTFDLFDIEYVAVQRVFTQPDYSIFSPMYPNSKPFNITYVIKAPKDHIIQITFVEFEFTSCKIIELDALITESHKVCYELNDYLRVSNGKGDLNDDLFKIFDKNNETAWVFCDCNAPLRDYISFSNELNLELLSRSTESQIKNRFRIAYGFIPNLQTSMKTAYAMQDPSIGYIEGYMLQIKVPLSYNLRFFGNSLRCELPNRSILYIERKTYKKIDFLTNTTNPQTNQPYCDYLFDINEPEVIKDDKNLRNENDGWFVNWLIQINNPLIAFGFEINWLFMKNIIINREQGLQTLPSQFGFNISNELSLRFEITTSRQYVITFEAKVLNDSLKFNNLLGDESYVKLEKSNKDTEDFIHPAYLEDSKNQLVIDSEKAILKVKRNNLWSMNVTYKLDSYFGDCNFDQSICGYQKENYDYYHLQHKLRKEWKFDIDETDDFYLAITKPVGSDVKKAVVYTPHIVMRNITKLKTMKKELFNRKIYSLSFSFKPGKPSDRLEVFLHTNRTEMYLTKNTDEIQVIKRFSIDDAEPIPIETSSAESQCSPSYSIISSHRSNTWYRVRNILLYSCYDFRLGFAAEYGQDNDFIDTISTVGIDDVNIDYKSDVKDCEENICGEHGHCINLFNKPICCCDTGYEGDKCEEKTLICPKNSTNEDYDVTEQRNDDELCENESTCIDSETEYNYLCSCKPGYTGKNCEIEIDECASEPCMNGGRCYDKIGYYRCSCLHGFSGVNCEIKEPGCEKCVNSTCIVHGHNQVVCICPRGRTGDDCSIDVDECSSNPCRDDNNSTCVNLEDSFKCLCSPGYTGKLCEVPIDYCKDKPKDICKHDGICISSNGKIACLCQLGYTGEFCEEEIDECEGLDNPCNGGECIDEYLDFSCECLRGRTGRYCENILENPCEGNKCVFGKCVPTFNHSYECVCIPYYQGEYCDKPKLCNVTEYAKECNQNGTLKVVGYGPTCLCKCKVGYYGEKCEFKENLCRVRDFTCLNGGTCIDNDDNVKCECRRGFSGNMCEIAENACRSQPCEHGRCKNFGSYYVCQCHRGWKGENCTELEKICDINEDCDGENTEEVYNYDSDRCLCICKEGFTGDKCEKNINDCELQKEGCHNGVCVDMLSSFRCQCNPGYTGNFCNITITGCDSNPCFNGTCISNADGSYKCECMKGYTGRLCETEMNNCDPNPCENGGTCHDYLDGYICECPSEYGNSRHCNEIKQNPCLKEPCYNNGTCMPLTTVDRSDQSSLTYTGFTCQCTQSYTGRQCETLKSPCLSSPCKNFGTCENSRDNRDYNCKCFPMFTGKSCESYYNACDPSPCLNNGTCHETPYGFICECPYIYTGSRCDRLADLCETFTCLNGGICQVEDNIPFCKCPNARFIGTRCEIDLKEKESIKDEALSEFLTKPAECGLLGNDATFLTYVLASLIIFFMFLSVVVLIYLYVDCSIKKFKKYQSQVLYERGLLREMNEFSNYRRTNK